MTLALVLLAGLVQAEPREADVLVYGGTPGGIAAALAAGREGRTVLLAEPCARVGGLTTNGLSHTDFRTFEGFSGMFLEFTKRVQEIYRKRYGPESPQARGNFRGTHAEPHVNQAAFDAMLAGVPTITVRTGVRLESVERKGDAIVAARFSEGLVCRAKIFIDGTYEGDLMAAAGVPFAVGREARATYGESKAPEQADGQVQGYNFRLIMTREPANRVMPEAPPGYRREDFVGILPLLESGVIKTVFCRWRGGMYKAQEPALPNGKFDINDVSHGAVRLSMPDISNGWPGGDEAARRRLFREHVRHNVGLIYFLQNDEAVPGKIREEARGWGFCRDEFVDTGHIPEQLYVREARRMVGLRVFTERDTDPAPGDARAVLKRDAIAMGDYGPNCHGTGHPGPRFGGKHTGEFYKAVAPYQVPYGTLVPRKVKNLLVPVAASASHVGFCALRLEPIWMALGQAAGTAAHVALDRAVPVQEVPVAGVQRRLHAAGASTIYTSDALPGSPDFAAVQWWGTAGGLHGLEPAPEKPGRRGKAIGGQYFEAFPGHAVRMEAPLGPELRARWEKLAASLGIEGDALKDAKTRGAFIRAAFNLCNR